MNGIFDAHKGVYRVNNADGTFDTYTPKQYRELVAKENEVETEDVVIVDQDILDQNPVLADAGVKVGDLGIPTNDVPPGAMVDENPPGAFTEPNLTNTVEVTNETNPQI